MTELYFYYYTPCYEHDFAVAQWYMRMKLDGDLDSGLFYTKSLSSVFDLLKNAEKVLVKWDEKGGFWFVAIFERLMGGIGMSYWLAKDRRQSVGSLEPFVKAVEWALETWPIVLGLVRDPKVLWIDKRMGAKEVGRIPGLWNGEDVYLVYVTKESFQMREVFSRRLPETEGENGERRATIEVNDRTESGS